MSATLQMIFSNAENRNSTISVVDADNTTGGDITGKVRSQLVSRTVDVLAEY